MNKPKHSCKESPAVGMAEAIKIEEPLLNDLVAASRARKSSQVLEIADKLATIRAIQEAAENELTLLFQG